MYFSNLPKVVAVKTRSTRTSEKKKSKSLDSSENTLRVKINVQEKSAVGVVKRGRPKKKKEPEELVENEDTFVKSSKVERKRGKPKRGRNSDSTTPKEEKKKSQDINISTALEKDTRETSVISDTEEKLIESTETKNGSKHGKGRKSKKTPNSDSTSKKEVKKSQESNASRSLEEKEPDTSQVSKKSNGIVNSQPLNGQGMESTRNNLIIPPDYSPSSQQSSVSRENAELKAKITTILHKLDTDSAVSNCSDSGGYRVTKDLVAAIADKLKRANNTGKDNLSMEEWRLKHQKAGSEIYTITEVDSSDSCGDKSRTSKNVTQKQSSESSYSRTESSKRVMKTSISCANENSKIDEHTAQSGHIHTEYDTITDAEDQLTVPKERQKGCEGNIDQPKRSNENVILKSSSSGNGGTCETSGETETKGSANTDIGSNKQPSDKEENIVQFEGHREIVIQKSDSSTNSEIGKASGGTEAEGSPDNKIMRIKQLHGAAENKGASERHTEIVIQESNLSTKSEIGKASVGTEAKGSAHNESHTNKRLSDDESKIGEPKVHNEICLQESPEVGEENTVEPKGHNEIDTQKSSSSSNGITCESSKEAEAEGSANNSITNSERSKAIVAEEDKESADNGSEGTEWQKEVEHITDSELLDSVTDAESQVSLPNEEQKESKEKTDNGSEGTEWQKEGEHITDSQLLDSVTDAESKVSLPNEEQKESKEKTDNGSEGTEWQKEGEHITDSQLLDSVTDAESQVSLPNEEQKESKEKLVSPNENIENIQKSGCCDGNEKQEPPATRKIDSEKSSTAVNDMDRYVETGGKGEQSDDETDEHIQSASTTTANSQSEEDLSGSEPENVIVRKKKTKKRNK